MFCIFFSLTIVRCRVLSVREIKPRIYRGNSLNRHFGRAMIAAGVSKQKSHPFKVQQNDNHVLFV